MNAIKIEDQIWTSENLAISSFQNGDEIHHAKSEDDWSQANFNKKPAYCFYENNEELAKSYGFLYNWFAVNDERGLVPKGWHIPHVLEIVKMLNHLDNANSLDYNNFPGDKKFFGQRNIAGGRLKSSGEEFWKSPNEGASNEFNFSALPAGYRDQNGNFGAINKDAFFWTKSQESFNKAYFLSVNYYDSRASILPNTYGYGLSIRCIKDA